MGRDDRADWTTEQWSAHCTELENTLAETSLAWENEEQANAKLRRRIEELSTDKFLQERIKRMRTH